MTRFRNFGTLSVICNLLTSSLLTGCAHKPAPLSDLCYPSVTTEGKYVFVCKLKDGTQAIKDFGDATDFVCRSVDEYKAFVEHCASK